MTNLKIRIEKAILIVTNMEHHDGSIGFDAKVSAHVLRNIGGARVSVYIHDKRG